MIDTKQQSYDFETVENDILEVKQYTLSNGLKLFLSVNPQEPRIFTNIAVRAGSKQDPPETTGMAHYMEHMLFKGTSKIGTIDWEKEKVLLEKISELYEAHRQSKDEEERQAIYKQIDEVSFEAAKLVAPNEYDKLSSSIGANGTNAYTWLDQTVYVNDIPANEIERWMKLESERFKMMALRLFHTELETVYEEFNINQDKDFRKVNKIVREELFPNHPYGTQTTIGSAEHLRNPSQVNIQKYFNTYYVPNNMALILAGDFDPDQIVALAEQYFGTYQAKEIPPFTYEEQPPIDQPIYREAFGQEAPYVMISWRFEGSQTDAPLYLSLIQHLLYNQQAGIFDLHLNQKQIILESDAWAWFYQDYSVFGVYGRAREGQSLEEVKNLLLAQVEKLKSGDFEDWLIDACVRDFKLGEMRSSESSQARVGAMTQSFILGVDWQRFAHRITWMEDKTKADIQAYTQKHLGENYVVVYKRQGEDDHVIKVEKPPITSVELQRDGLSDFAKSFLAEESPRLSAEFVRFDKLIHQDELMKGIEFDYVYNPNNSLFQLNYIFEMGKNHDRELAIALLYLPYLGTNKFSPAQLQQEFFRLGLNFEVTNNNERCYVTLEGLQESFEEGIQLFEHILAHVEPNPAALDNVVMDILTKRANAKQNKSVILRDALGHYARYGTKSPFTWRLMEADLKTLSSDLLIDKIKHLNSFEHKVYYYGQAPKTEIAALLKQYHKVGEALQPMPKPQVFEQQVTKPKVVFLDFPSVQADVMMISKGTPHFSREEFLMSEIYNSYFGYGLSSIVFQEIREAKALAYSTYAYYGWPNKKNKAHYLQAYVGTQPDKLSDAIPALLEIINEMPMATQQFEAAKEAILKRIETERLAPSKVYWKYRSYQMIGFNHDLRKDAYEFIQKVSPEDLLAFQKKYVKDRDFTFVVMGSKDRIDLDYLAQFGPIEEVSLEQIFGY